MGIGMAIQDDDNGPGNSYNGYWVSTGDINMYFHARLPVRLRATWF